MLGEKQYCTFSGPVSIVWYGESCLRSSQCFSATFVHAELVEALFLGEHVEMVLVNFTGRDYEHAVYCGCELPLFQARLC